MSPGIPSEVPILIVGGGGCGLSLSVMLADLGAESLLVERHPDTAIMPKAHILNPRTMEIFHQHGLDEDVYRVGPPREANATCRWFTSLRGPESWDARQIHVTDAWGGNSLVPVYAPLSASRHGNVPQIALEPLLRRHAEERNPGRVLFHHELVSFEQDADGVTAQILDRDSGTTSAVRAQYLVGADGGKTVGDALGIALEGPEPFVEAVNVYFRADLSQYLTNDDSVIRLFIRPSPDGSWTRTGLVAHGPTNWNRHSETWVCGLTKTDHALTVEEAIAGVRQRLGVPDLEMEVIRYTNWVIEAVLAERYREGRAFLAGDAAHRHSPMGGLGLNSGIQDAHNLSWKLAAVVSGQADPGLLDAYEAERRPVGQQNVEFATSTFFAHLAVSGGFGQLEGAPESHNRQALEELFSDTKIGGLRRERLRGFFDTLRLEFAAPDQELGFEYAASPAVVPDGTPAPPRDPAVFEYVQVARPGHRLPHAWLERYGTHVPTHHLVTPGTFVLLAGDEGHDWVEAATTVGARLGVRVLAERVGPTSDLRDRDGAWATLRGHDERGAVLVRPDAHIVFRAASAVDDAAATLEAALRTSLGAPAAVGAGTAG